MVLYKIDPQEFDKYFRINYEDSHFFQGENSKYYYYLIDCKKGIFAVGRYKNKEIEIFFPNKTLKDFTIKQTPLSIPELAKFYLLYKLHFMKKYKHT